MNKPRLFSDSGLSRSWVELTVLYSLTTAAAMILFNMDWVVAMTVSPAIMLGMLLSVITFVQVSWMLVVGLERLGSAAGLRKSPLS